MMNRADLRFGLDRRTFLLGVAATGVAAACGGDGDGDGDGAGAGDGSGEGDDASGSGEPFSIVQRFPSDVLVPGEIRLPFSIARAAEFITDGPEQLAAELLDLDGNSLGETLTAVRRDISPAPYYAFRTTIDTPGIYALRIDGGPDEGANFQVLEPSAVAIPVPGDPLTGFDTPTVDDVRGVDPICTREPQCPFHEMTLTEAIAAGDPVAYFIGTPAFCRTGTCTPALETLVSVSPDYPDMAFVHAEVWTDGSASEVAPAVVDLGLAFEPALYLTDSSGVVVERIDGLWDATELRERLDVVTG